ncbi:MAG: M20/M25/M40 family metallo-hydrolase [Planctomycetaceae bacterium]
MVLALAPLLAALTTLNGVVADEPGDLAAKTAATADAISADAMRRHVEHLASPELEGRGTPHGKELAAEYIRSHFEKLGLRPLFPGESWFQEIPGSRPREGGDPQVLGRNIGAFLSGTDPQLKDEVVILSAHYDHLGIRAGKIYPGADDNAGSVAMLLEVARRFARSPVKPRRTLVFLSCDLEEQMLWGSRWFVAHPPWPLERVKLFVTSELIGRDLGDLPLETIFVLGSEHATGMKDLIASLPAPEHLQVAHLGVDLIGVRSDYGPFWTEKIPFVFFSGGEHRDYHQPTDTADRLDYRRAAAVANLVWSTLRPVADGEISPTWTDTPPRDLDEVRTLHRITQLLLDSDDAARDEGRPRLSNLQRFSVSNVHTKTKQILERGELKADERPWLIRSSQLLLLTVF